MRQYVLPKTFHGEETVTLSEKEAKYLTKVLRFRVGQQFSGIDASGTIWDVTIMEGNKLRCAPAENGKPRTTSDTLPAFLGPYPHLHLYQCLCKGKKDEDIVRAATEIGVETITFVQSRFCTVDLSEKTGKALTSRNERLEAIIKEALQQSGSPVPTTLTERILTITDISQTAKGTKLFFHQSPIGDTSLPALLATIPPKEQEVSLLVGSEGGFSDEECRFLIKDGFRPVLLKTNILRAETAAIYALSACQVLLTEHIRPKEDCDDYSH